MKHPGPYQRHRQDLDPRPAAEKSRRKPVTTKAKIKRALDAVAEAGLTMEVRIEPDGTIRLLPTAPNPPQPDPREPEAW
ncbi:hypothetical protein EMVG_00033 [Emiliania huxleyi virus PS401]|nr:hypothetical protein EMVG_00033 [Emiliania huxleyi virus PS401]